MIKRYLLYGLIGWSMEIIWTGLDSMIHGDLRLIGFTNLWMFFIYGTAVFLEPIHDRIEHWRWPIRGVTWLLIIWAIEYLSGSILVAVLGVYPWEYTGPLAINGLITLGYTPAWFAAGLIFEKIHHTLDVYEFRFRNYEKNYD